MNRFVVALSIGLYAFSTGASQQNVRGRWEGVIEAASRPVVVFVDFDKLEASLNGGPAIRVTRGSSETVEFEVGGRQQVLRFAGNRTGDLIKGVVRGVSGDIPFWLELLPDVPPPATRADAWRQDLDVVLTRFLRYDRSFSTTQRAAAQARLQRLKDAATSLRDEEILVELSRSLALSGNAHTRLYFIRNRTAVRRVPLRLWWFRDELRIVRAAATHRELLRCRVLKIGDLDTPSAAQRLRGIKAGNDSWQRYMSVYFLTSPDVLFGAGVIRSPDHVALTVSCGGQRRTVDIEPLPLQKSNAPVEAWWDIVPSYPHGDSFETAIASPTAPRYLRNAVRNYWFEYLADSGVLYIQYNRSQEAPEDPMSAFIDRLKRVIDDRPSLKGIVVDVRFNTGGDAGVGTPLVEQLVGRLRRLPVFVLTGRATFSAGIIHTAQWKQFASATLIGERVGDMLDMWAEGGNLLLPNSGLTVHYANAFHANSDREYPQFRPYFSDLNVASVEPDVLREVSWDDYLAGRDPLLDEAIVRIKRSHPTQRDFDAPDAPASPIAKDPMSRSR
jgi:hypothetical protein